MLDQNRVARGIMYMLVTSWPFRFVIYPYFYSPIILCTCVLIRCIEIGSINRRNVLFNREVHFVKDGVFKAELNRFLTNELAEDGYSGVQVRHTPARTEIIILATRTQNVLGEKGRRIRELTSLVQKRFGFADGTVELYAEKVAQRGLCAIAQAESLRYKLVGL